MHIITTRRILVRLSIIAVQILFLMTAFTQIGLAVHEPNHTGGSPQPNQFGQNPNCGTGDGLTNPLKACSIQEFLMAVIDILLTLALPIVVFFIIYGGFLLVVAQGEPEKIKTGRKAILWAVVGGVVILSARIIFYLIENTVNAL